MKPISLKNFDQEKKILENHGGVCFVFKFDKETLPSFIDNVYLEDFYNNLLLISESEGDYFDRIEKHIKSFLGITVGVDTGEKLAECAKENGHNIDDLYAICLENLSKEAEINRFEAKMKRLPCGNKNRR